MCYLLQVDEFKKYVCPVIHTVLSEFCTSLTGITQEQVTNAECFPSVLEDAEAWMSKYGLGYNNSFAVVTDG